MPFLSVGGDLGWREEVSRGVSELSGEFCVENVRGEDGELYRRLVFLSNVALVQSESRLVSPKTSELFAFFLSDYTLFFGLSIFYKHLNDPCLISNISISQLCMYIFTFITLQTQQ